MNKNIIKILLVEDEKLVRYGIKTVIEKDPEFKVFAEADKGKQAAECAVTLKPDIILLDLRLPDISGINVLKMLKNGECTSKTVILSSHTDPDDINTAISYGIYAYIIKDICEESLLNVLKTVYKGAMWFDPKIVPLIRKEGNIFTKEKRLSRSEFKNRHANLTQREFEVLKLVVDGNSNNEIAQKLCISEHTAKAHVCNIIQKMVVEDRTQAAVKALKEGIIN